jgi:hypothetical protein
LDTSCIAYRIKANKIPKCVLEFRTPGAKITCITEGNMKIILPTIFRKNQFSEILDKIFL